MMTDQNVLIVCELQWLCYRSKTLTFQLPIHSNEPSLNHYLNSLNCQVSKGMKVPSLNHYLNSLNCQVSKGMKVCINSERGLLKLKFGKLIIQCIPLFENIPFENLAVQEVSNKLVSCHMKPEI